MPTERESTIDYFQTLVDELLPPPPDLSDDDPETMAIREALLAAIEAFKNGFPKERNQIKRLRAAILEAVGDVTMHPDTRDQLLAALVDDPPVDDPPEREKQTRAERLRGRGPLDDL